MKHKLSLILLSSIMIFSGCSKKEEVTADEIIQSFYTNTHQIKAQMNLISDDISALLEAYIDASGSGTGLLSVGSIICEVIFINNDMYIDVLDNTYCVENIGYQLSFDKLDLDDITLDNIVSAGFTLEDNDIVGFNATVDGVQISNKYAKSNKIIEQSTSTKDIVISLNDFLRLLSKVNSPKSDDIGIIGALAVDETKDEKEQKEGTVEEKKPSYYVNSEIGIKIKDKVFSINDYINVEDYYFNIVPEGINYKTEWDKDNKVTLCYASYIDTTGKFTAMYTNNIVYKLAVDCDFEFLDFASGQSFNDISKILGVKLNNKKKKDFKPIRDDITITKTGTDFIRFTIGDFKVRFGFNKDKLLSSMTIEKERDYKKYDED